MGNYNGRIGYLKRGIVMSKELTPLQALEKLTNYKCSCMSEKIECKNIIETALKDYERLKTSYLEKILNEESKEYIYKKLKALEIIKEKRVDVALLILCENAEDYNFQISLINEDNENYKELTQEEYELLVEVLL